jgi:hypothetical protein
MADIKPPTLTHSVIAEPLGSPVASSMGDFIFSFASVADDLPQFGTNILGRDRALRAFWPTETLTSSAVFSMAAKYASLEWSLDGPPRTVGIYQRILNSVESGEGWIPMWLKVLTDVFTLDNGAFIEIVRTADDPSAPVVSLNHLDSNRCTRTGHRMTPVLYFDILGNAHLMKWYQIISFTEFPSPIEIFRGIQLCAISRILRAAQIMRDISVYEREKVSGRFNRAMYFVSGVQQRSIDNMLKEQELKSTEEGLTRYIHPLVIASLDPGAQVKVDVINFAALPEGFDKETAMKWYISQLALGFGGDYQDFAPLPTGQLGGSAGASQTLHHKALGKGIKMFMSQVKQIMNYRGILPSNIKFTYGESDLSEDSARADMKLNRAKERQIRIMSGEITLPIARQIAADAGDLEYTYLMKMNEESNSSTVDVNQDDPMGATPELAKVGNDDAYTGPTDTGMIPGTSTWGQGIINGGDTSNSNGQAASPNKMPPKKKPAVTIPQ